MKIELKDGNKDLDVDLNDIFADVKSRLSRDNIQIENKGKEVIILNEDGKEFMESEKTTILASSIITERL